MNNPIIEETIIISEAITQTLNNINEKLNKGEDVSDLVVNLNNLANRLNKRSERLNKKYVSNNTQELEEVKTVKVIEKTDSETTIMNKIPQKYHEYILEVGFAIYYQVKLKEGYVAKNTQLFGEEFVNILTDLNLSKIISNLKTIKSV